MLTGCDKLKQTEIGMEIEKTPEIAEVISTVIGMEIEKTSEITEVISAASGHWYTNQYIISGIIVGIVVAIAFKIYKRYQKTAVLTRFPRPNEVWFTFESAPPDEFSKKIPAFEKIWMPKQQGDYPRFLIKVPKGWRSMGVYGSVNAEIRPSKIRNTDE
jgi:hypothetical protein